MALGARISDVCPHVGEPCERFEMAGVYAALKTALMVEIVAFGDRCDEVFKCKPMRSMSCAFYG